MIKVSRYGAACFLNTPFINLIYWYRSDILYFLMSLHRANQRMTGTGIEKTKSESFYQIRRKVKLRFDYQKEYFCRLTVYSRIETFQKKNIVTYFFFLNFIAK